MLVLNDRKKKLLHMVVQEFIRTGKPVGSKVICEHYALNISSATVRNDLAELEKDGFLSHPHTSAGRIPTDKGYKYYVETLIEIQKLTREEESVIRQQFSNKMRELEEVMTQTSKLLATVSHYAGFVVTSNISKSIVQHIELTRIDAQRILAVIITQNGLVRHKILPMPPHISEKEIRHLVSVLNERLRGHTINEVKKRIVTEIEQEQRKQREILQVIHELSEKLFTIIDEDMCFFEGTGNIMGIDDKHNIESMYRVMEEKQMLAHILEENMNIEGVHVQIGSKDLGKDMSECSLVTSTYKSDDNLCGVLGVIGPKRMEYSKMIALVDFMATAINKIMKKDHGQ